ISLKKERQSTTCEAVCGSQRAAKNGYVPREREEMSLQSNNRSKNHSELLNAAGLALAAVSIVTFSLVPNAAAEPIHSSEARGGTSSSYVSPERYAELVQAAEKLYLAGRYDEAALRLYEIVENPKYQSLRNTADFRSAEFMLAGALKELGA